jgi:nucleotide sugar dehydrogenase
MIKIGIVGRGFVGNAVAEGFKNYAEIKIYDIDKTKRTHSFQEVIFCDFVFVALPTPMVSAEGGECNLSIIENFFNDVRNEFIQLAKWPEKNVPIFIIKSTVPVGTTKALNEKYNDCGIIIVHNPEFLTARNAIHDFCNPERNIVGGCHKEAVEKVANLLRNRFPQIPCHTMLSDESEMVKYMANCCLATKVIFFNEMKLLVDKLKLNWSHVLEGVLSDSRIGRSHTQVPGVDESLGVGGMCFPKDLNAIISVMEKNNIDPLVLKAVWEQNKRVRPKEYWDWAKNPSAVKGKDI